MNINIWWLYLPWYSVLLIDSVFLIRSIQIQNKSVYLENKWELQLFDNLTFFFSFRRSFQYIVVSGPAVKATSVVITQRISTADQRKEKLRKLNDVNERGRIKFRFAFMLIQNSNPNLSVESVSFREVFPGVPLIGFRHTGQIGMDYPIRRNSTKLNVFQDFSSVFLMVTVYEAWIFNHLRGTIWISENDALYC